MNFDAVKADAEILETGVRSQETGAELGAKRLEDFEQGPWGKKIPAIAQCWRRVLH